MKRIKVLIVDDSALTRSILKEIIGSDRRMEIVGTAMNPMMALEKIPNALPDVLTVDLVMPVMDGITFLKELIKRNIHIPSIVISGNSPKDSSNAISALEYGAVDIIEKPNVSSDEKYNEVKSEINEAIYTAYHSKKVMEKDFKLSYVEKKSGFNSSIKKESEQFYVIGSSTGGPKLLKDLFLQISPSVSKGFVVAQHMPAGFTKSFAERLNEEISLKVKESVNFEKIENGKVIIIPGDYHGLIQKNHEGYYVKLVQTEKVNRHRPSVDVLFESAAHAAGKDATGIILTGMGSDGANGLKLLRETGAKTLAQDEKSCAVFGMPKVALEIGAAQIEVSPLEIVQIINEAG